MAAKKKAKPLKPVTMDLRDWKKLIEHDPAPDDVLAVALQRKESALMHLGLGLSPLTSEIFARIHRQIPTTAVPTAAVTLTGDGTPMLMYNPHFFASLDDRGAEFVLFHEARHLIQRHLFSDPLLNQDLKWTMSTEANNNHVGMVRLKMDMPTAEVEVVDPKSGSITKERQPTGVDPRELYKQYSEDLTKQGLTEVSYDEFTSTDFACYTELSRMKPEKQESGGGGQCVHQQDGDGAGNGDGSIPMDQESLDEVVKSVLHSTMQAALNGNEKARAELLELGERTDGESESASKIWGDLGLGRLRGETLAVRKVEWWKTWLNDTLASKLQEGERLVYPKKRGAIDLAMNLDPMLARRGMDELKVVLVAIDTSGSMGGEVIDYLTKLVGQTDGVETHWVSFDGSVMPFKPGERVMGGGGTNFDNVMHYAEGRLAVDGYEMDVHPDAVIMLTDGYAAPIRPSEPDKWIWLITEGGSDSWIKAQNNPMDSHELVTGEGLS